MAQQVFRSSIRLLPSFIGRGFSFAVFVGVLVFSGSATAIAEHYPVKPSLARNEGMAQLPEINTPTTSQSRNRAAAEQAS